jgi:hypothetical protein
LFRHVPRFQLHTLLVLVTVVGVAFALVGKELHAVRWQKQAAQEVQRRGGHARFASVHDEPKNKGVISGWLRLLFG